MIGRDASCHVRIDHSLISRRHCRITRDDGRVMVEDLDSLYGTEINDQPIDRVEVRHFDRLKVGAERFLFVIESDTHGTEATSKAVGNWTKFRVVDCQGITAVKILSVALVKESEIRGFTDELVRLIDSGENRIVLNFATVASLSSQVIATLIKAHRQCLAAGGVLKLCKIQPHLAEVFAITHLDSVIDIFPEERPALESDWPPATAGRALASSRMIVTHPRNGDSCAIGSRISSAAPAREAAKPPQAPVAPPLELSADPPEHLTAEPPALLDLSTFDLLDATTPDSPTADDHDWPGLSRVDDFPLDLVSATEWPPAEPAATAARAVLNGTKSTHHHVNGRNGADIPIILAAPPVDRERDVSHGRHPSDRNGMRDLVPAKSPHTLADRAADRPIQPARASVGVHLIAQVGRDRGRVVEMVASKSFIGRDACCRIRALSPAINRIHALIEQRGGRVFLRDLESATGTMLNERVLRGEEVEVSDGDRLQVGRLQFLFAIRPPEVPTAPRSVAPTCHDGPAHQAAPYLLCPQCGVEGWVPLERVREWLAGIASTTSPAIPSHPPTPHLWSPAPVGGVPGSPALLDLSAFQLADPPAAHSTPSRPPEADTRSFNRIVQRA